ncbi:MAG: NB-ARC domain-containing protein, partial [Cyanobacteria bacterium P01_F01_bin.53]
MPRTPSIRLTDTAKPIAEKNARARGFNNQSKELAELAKTTVSTLKRFWAQDGINRFTFEDISKELGFDNWQDIGEEVTPGNKKEQVTSDQKEHVKPNTQSVAHNIPRTISGPFIGRDLVEFHHVVQGATESNIVNVVGMGGIGKTELTMRYGREFQAEYPKGVCWIDVRAGKITQQLLRYFKAILKLSFPDNLKTAQAKLVYGFAAWPGIREALIIFDDVDDFSQVSPYIPTDETFKVIITSRKTFNNTFITYSLDELSEIEALEVIKGILKPDDERLTTQLSSIQEVCDYVEYLPLGLQLIARFAKQMPTWPFIWIYQQLKDYELKAESLTKTEPLMSPCPRGVKAALELSWDHLKKNPLTQHLACLLSLFGTNYTLLPYITSCMPNQEPQKLEVLLKLQLVNFSIVQEYVFPDDLYGEVAIYKLHHLVYLFLKSKLNKADKDGAIRRQFCSFFSEYADLYRFQNTIKGRIADYHILLPIIERIYLEYRKYLTCAAHDLARLSNIAAILNQTQGQAIEAREWFHSCIFHTRCAYGRHSKREAFVRSKLLDLPEANPKIIGEVQADIHRFIHK